MVGDVDVLRHLPKGFTPPSSPSIPGRPHIPAPKGHSLLCTKIIIEGVPDGHATHPWVDCEVVNGPRADGPTGAGLRGNTEKRTSGNRLFVAHPEAAVAHATVTFEDGRRVTAGVVTVPSTAYRAYAVPIASGQTIASVDEYDAHNHLLSHNTQSH